MGANIKVYEDVNGTACDKYTVLIGSRGSEDVFTMSENSDQPNGVNMYAGQVGDTFPTDFMQDQERVNLKSLPKGVLVSIIGRMRGYEIF
jgi:hypothetical protein